MTNALYTRSAATALRLLTAYGRSVTHRAYSAGTYDPATGTNTQTSADTTRQGALFDYDENVQYVRGTMVVKTDKQLLLDPTAPVDLNDRFIAGGVEYSIVSMGEVNPAGTPVLYDIHLRV